MDNSPNLSLLSFKHSKFNNIKCPVKYFGQQFNFHPKTRLLTHPGRAVKKAGRGVWWSLLSLFPSSLFSLSQLREGEEAEGRQLCVMGWPRALWPGRALELALSLIGAFVDPYMAPNGHLLPGPRFCSGLSIQKPSSQMAVGWLSPSRTYFWVKETLTLPHPSAGRRRDPLQVKPVLSWPRHRPLALSQTKSGSVPGLPLTVAVRSLSNRKLLGNDGRMRAEAPSTIG